MQRWPACEMTTTSPGLRSEEREEHEELRRPSPRGRPRLGLLDPPGGDGQGRSKRQRPSLGKRVKVRKREGVQFYLENCTVSLPNVSDSKMLHIDVSFIWGHRGGQPTIL